MEKLFHIYVQEFQKHVNQICALIDFIHQNRINYNPTMRAINLKLAEIDALKTKIYDYIEKNLTTIEINPDYKTYQTIQKKFLDSLLKYDDFLSPQMQRHK